MEDNNIKLAKVEEKINNMENKISDIEGTLDKYDYKFEENSKVTNSLILTISKLDMTLSGFMNKFDTMLSVLNEDRKKDYEKMDNIYKKIDVIENKDGDKAKKFVAWLSKNIGGFILGLIGAGLMMLLNIK